MELEKHEEAIDEACKKKFFIHIRVMRRLQRQHLPSSCLQRWSLINYTFVCSWGEFTPTLKDVNNVMRLPLTREADPFNIKLSVSEAEREKLGPLKGGVCRSREKFLFLQFDATLLGFG